MKKHIIVSALFLTLGAGVLGVRSVAAENAINRDDLVSAIAKKFNLKQEDVQAVFDAKREEHQAEMQKNMSTRLDEAVKNGKITEQQKQLILAKQKELQANREKQMENWKNMTPEERRSVGEAQRTAITTWAQQNGIDLQYVMGGMGRHGRMGGMMK